MVVVILSTKCMVYNDINEIMIIRYTIVRIQYSHAKYEQIFSPNEVVDQLVARVEMVEME